MITDVELAEKIIGRGEADLVALGRELLHDPFWPVRARHFLREAMALDETPSQFYR